MEYHEIVLYCVVAWLVFIYFIVLTYRQEKEHEIRMLVGTPIEKLEDGIVYYQCPQPIGLIFLSKNTGIDPKVYILDFDIKKLPDSFMSLQEGEKIVPWYPVYLYEKGVEKVPGAPDEENLKKEDNTGTDEKPLASELDELQDEIIELKEMAGKQPE